MKLLNVMSSSSTLVSYTECSKLSSLLFTHNTEDAKLKLFGSSANAFGSRSSDIDISMWLPGNFDVHEVWILMIGEFILC